MRKVFRLIMGSVGVGIFLAAGTSAAAVHFSSAAASDHSITAQPVAAQPSGDRTAESSQGRLDELTDDSTSGSRTPELEPADDSHAANVPGDDSAAHATDDSSRNVTTSVAEAGDDHGSGRGH